ncbi:hypothetical protein J3458_002637 [Metarhizium acridum]|uniref:uncharacterized protein n=1 Tax=Metarhizium acridum TaxID=92637 RepID=UPI001C6C9296|nr:hypothetical protein J3458_002637 [Metarhizium acridum]
MKSMVVLASVAALVGALTPAMNPLLSPSCKDRKGAEAIGQGEGSMACPGPPPGGAVLLGRLDDIDDVSVPGGEHTSSARCSLCRDDFRAKSIYPFWRVCVD